MNWGGLVGEEQISTAIKAAYAEVITWKKNFFSLPCGKSGTESHGPILINATHGMKCHAEMWEEKSR